MSIELTTDELRTKFRVYDLLEKKYLGNSIVFYLNNNGTLYVFDNTNTLRTLPLDRFIVENAYLNQNNGVNIMGFLFTCGSLLGSLSGEKKKELENQFGKEVIAELIDVLQKISNAMSK